MYTKRITTKSGYKTHIDRYAVIRNGKKHSTVWGKTKAFEISRSMTSNLFHSNNDKIEIVNENTGEIFKIQ